MIYKVQFQIHRRGYRKLRLEGLYVPETGVEMSVPEMKRDVTEFIKRQLSSRNKEFENFQMEQTNNAKARYIPTRVAVCKRCEGKGVVFEYSDENRTKVSGSCQCPTCLGSGRVKVTSSVITTIKPFVPGKDDKEGMLAM